MTVVASLTFTLGASPALATPNVTDFSEAGGPAAYAALSQQSLVTTDDTLTSESLDAMINATTFDPTKLTHGYDVDAAIALAKSEVGTSRATGWSAEGECVMSVRRWVTAGDASWGGGPGTPVGNYANATRVPVEAALPGDVIQYEHLEYPDQWVSGVHTMLVTGVNDDGTLQIIQSNIPFGSGLVTEEDHFTPAPPEGFQASVWRF